MGRRFGWIKAENHPSEFHGQPSLSASGRTREQIRVREASGFAGITEALQCSVF
jgi:hypothetical protein